MHQCSLPASENIQVRVVVPQNEFTIEGFLLTIPCFVDAFYRRKKNINGLSKLYLGRKGEGEIAASGAKRLDLRNSKSGPRT